MKDETNARRAAPVFQNTTVADFLGLTKEEEMLVEVHVLLAALVRKQRVECGLTQTQLAKCLGTRQQAVARLESGVGSVTIDALASAFLACGGSPEEIACIWVEAARNIEEEHAHAGKSNDRRDGIFHLSNWTPARQPHRANTEVMTGRLIRTADYPQHLREASRAAQIEAPSRLAA